MEEWRLSLEVTMRILWRRCFGHVPLQTDLGLAVSMAERKEIARLVASVRAVRALGHHYEMIWQVGNREVYVRPQQ